MGHLEDDAVHKIPHEMKRHWQIRLKILVLVKDLKSSIIELDNKGFVLYLSGSILIRILLHRRLVSVRNVNSFPIKKKTKTKTKTKTNKQTKKKTKRIYR